MDQEDIQLDIAGSFFMNLIGQNMQVFVKVLQKITIPPTQKLAEELTKLQEGQGSVGLKGKFSLDLWMRF